MRALLLALVLFGDDPSLRAAKEHFAAGRAAYDEGAYDTAIREFKAAREAKPSPLLDYNIALAYERLGRLDLAKDGYETYLRDKPDAANRTAVEERVRGLRERIAREGPYAAPPPVSPPPAHGPAPPESMPAPGAPPTPAPPDVAPALPATPAFAAPPSPPYPTAALTSPPPAAAATSPVGPRPVASRLAVGLRLGPGGTGGLGNHAYGGALHVTGPSALVGGYVRASIPGTALQAEVAILGQSFRVQPEAATVSGFKGSLGYLALRGKALYAFQPSPLTPLELAFGVGFDLTWFTFNATFAYTAPGGGGPQAHQDSTRLSSSLPPGLFIETLTLRYVVRRHLEIVLSPLCLRALPPLSPPANTQLRNPATGNMEPAAKVLDMNKGALSASFELAAGWRW